MAVEALSMESKGMRRADRSGMQFLGSPIKDNQVQRTFAPLKAGVLGLGLLCTSQLAAQSKSTSSSAEGGVVNAPKEAPAQQSNQNSSGQIQMKDLLNYKVRAKDGAFGRVSDIVLDRSGNVQYMLGSHQGQTFPLPFSRQSLSGAPNTISLDATMEVMQQLSIDPKNLPSLTDQAFTQKMQEVFGQSFGANNGQMNGGNQQGTQTNTQGNPNGTQGDTQNNQGIQTNTQGNPNGTQGDTQNNQGIQTNTQGNPNGTRSDQNSQRNNGLGVGNNNQSAATDVAGGAVAGGGANVGANTNNGRPGFGGVPGSTSGTSGNTGSSAASGNRSAWAWPNGGNAGTMPAPSGEARNRFPPPPFKTFTPGKAAGAGTGAKMGTGNNGNEKFGAGSKTGEGSKTGNGSKTGEGSNTQGGSGAGGSGAGGSTGGSGGSSGGSTGGSGS